MLGREAFQEIDYRQMFGPMAKWVAQIDRGRARSPSSSRAPSTSRPRAGRGPSCSRCPRTCSSRRPTSPTRRPYTPTPAASRRRRPRAAARRCSQARGAAARDRRRRAAGARQAHDDARRLVRGERAAGRRVVPLPGLRRQRLARLRRAPHARPGPAARARACATPTCSLVVGDRLGEITTAGYTLLDVPRPRQALVHVHPDPDELGARLPARARDRRRPRAVRGGAARRAAARRSALARRDGRRRAPTTSRTSRHTPAARRPRPGRGDGAPARAPARRRDHHERRRQLLGLGAPLLRVPHLPRRQLAPTSGSMGYGVPAAVAAKLVEPERDRRRVRRRRRLPDDRAGARDRGAVRAPRSSCSSSTTACTGRSACTRSATTRAASAAPTSSTRTSPRSRRPSAPTASGSSGRRTSPPRSSARSRPDGRPCSTSRVDPEAITPRQTLTEIREQALAKS